MQICLWTCLSLSIWKFGSKERLNTCLAPPTPPKTVGPTRATWRFCAEYSAGGRILFTPYSSPLRVGANFLRQHTLSTLLRCLASSLWPIYISPIFYCVSRFKIITLAQTQICVMVWVILGFLDILYLCARDLELRIQHRLIFPSRFMWLRNKNRLDSRSGLVKVLRLGDHEIGLIKTFHKEACFLYIQSYSAVYSPRMRLLIGFQKFIWS